MVSKVHKVVGAEAHGCADASSCEEDGVFPASETNITFGTIFLSSSFKVVVVLGRFHEDSREKTVEPLSVIFCKQCNTR